MRPITNQKKLAKMSQPKYVKKNVIAPEFPTEHIVKSKPKKNTNSVETHKDIDCIELNKQISHIYDEGKELKTDIKDNTKNISGIRPVYRERLNSITNCRKTMANIIRANSRGLLTDEQARSKGYMLQVLSSLFKVEMELTIQSEIRSLRKEVRNMQNNEYENVTEQEE